MEHSKTPPWAKRIEKEVAVIKRLQLASLVPCYYHKKYGDAADRCEKGLCSVYVTKIGLEEVLQDQSKSSSSKDGQSLSPIVDSILRYMKPAKFISPIQNSKKENVFKEPAPVMVSQKRRTLEDDVIPIHGSTFKGN